jgi:hypothetical protein
VDILMERMWRDLRYGIRSLRRGGLLIAIALLSLGIGIGSVTTIFSAVDVFMLRPLPFPESDDLHSVYTTNHERGWTRVSFSVPDFVDFRDSVCWACNRRSAAASRRTKRPRVAIEWRSSAMGCGSVASEVIRTSSEPPSFWTASRTRSWV